MKPKYFLENYDRIVTEIKNPKIIFSNDLTPFLESFTSESFMVYQINFQNKKNKIEYVIKKPIHNLHPKVFKLNFKNTNMITEFEVFFPQISQELNIPICDMNWSLCCKNKNTIYVLQKCELENLSQENRFFLYCYHSLKMENQKIKKFNKEKVFKLKSNERIQQYIHQKQNALENLAHRLIKEINPVNASELYQFSNNYDKNDCFKIAYAYLEKLLHFIEKEYRNYLNLNSQIPNRSTLIKEFEIKNKLKEVKSKIKEGDCNCKLLTLVNEPLLKITTVNIQKKITYYEFNYCSKYIIALHKKINLENGSETVLKEFLFDLNFNSLQFFKYLTSEMHQELEKQENDLKKIDNLNQFLKNYNQKQSRNSLKFKPNLPPIKEQIISWIEEEIDYLTKKIKLETNQFSKEFSKEEKIKFLSGLSVAQLSYFFGILMDIGIIKHKNQTDIFRFIAENFKTSNTEKISVDSIKVKYYNVENATKNAIRKKITELIALTKL